MAILYFSLTFLILLITGSDSATFTLINQCPYTIWPGLLSGAGTPPLSTTGFELPTGTSNSVIVPAGWSGRLWGRSLCTSDSTGKFTCETGDCGSGTVECSGSGAAPPTSLAEFTLNGAGGFDFYDVSFVDGYNLPMMISPTGGINGNCTTTGCGVDLNAGCPTELKVLSQTDPSVGVACKSACLAFGDPQYCCSGEYGTPDKCTPSSYSQYFKTACPRVYSYAYDDGTSTFTCASADYSITFCPLSDSPPNSSSGPQIPVQIPGAAYVSPASSGSGLTYSTPQILLTLFFTAIWRLW